VGKELKGKELHNGGDGVGRWDNLNEKGKMSLGLRDEDLREDYRRSKKEEKKLITQNRVNNQKGNDRTILRRNTESEETIVKDRLISLRGELNKEGNGGVRESTVGGEN